MSLLRKYAERIIEDVDYDIYKDWMNNEEEDWFSSVEVQLDCMLDEALGQFDGVQYAVVNDKNQIVRAAGGNSYALYKTLIHAEKKLRWGHGKWRIVKVGFQEIDDELSTDG